MATRWYLPSDTIAPPNSPSFDSGWDDTSIAVRTTFSTVKRDSAMTTVSFADNNATSREILFKQYHSSELTAGQTITGEQNLELQIRGSQVALTNNMFLVIKLLIVNGTTTKKTMVFIGSGVDNNELATSLTNRRLTQTSEPTNYTTVVGDYLMLEIGTRGDPDTGSDHDSSLRFGDVALTDLTEDDVSILDLNPWVELTDTLTFGGGLAIGPIMAAARPPLSRTGIGIRRALARRNFREIRAEIMRKAS